MDILEIQQELMSNGYRIVEQQDTNKEYHVSLYKEEKSNYVLKYALNTESREALWQEIADDMLAEKKVWAYVYEYQGNLIINYTHEKMTKKHAQLYLSKSTLNNPRVIDLDPYGVLIWTTPEDVVKANA